MNQGPSETATLSEIRQLLHTLVAKVDSLSLRLDNLERGQSAESQPAPSVGRLKIFSIRRSCKPDS